MLFSFEGRARGFEAKGRRGRRINPGKGAGTRGDAFRGCRVDDGRRAGLKMKAMAGHDGLPSVFEGEKQEWEFDGQWKLR